MINQQWQLTAISINVNGIATGMWLKLKSQHKQKFDVVFLQETKLTSRETVRKLEYA